MEVLLTPLSSSISSRPPVPHRVRAGHDDSENSRSERWMLSGIGAFLELWNGLGPDLERIVAVV